MMEAGPHNSPENSSLGSGSVGESDGHMDSIYNNKSKCHMTCIFFISILYFFAFF